MVLTPRLRFHIEACDVCLSVVGASKDGPSEDVRDPDLDLDDFNGETLKFSGSTTGSVFAHW